jgi:plasmid stabilization system protein ParE
MNRYALSSEALVDLDEIWEFIAQDDVEAAGRWIAKLLDTCEIVARNPHVGHPDRMWLTANCYFGQSASTSSCTVTAVTESPSHPVLT